jgi:hypothetical protein
MHILWEEDWATGGDRRCGEHVDTALSRKQSWEEWVWRDIHGENHSVKDMQLSHLINCCTMSWSVDKPEDLPGKVLGRRLVMKAGKRWYRPDAPTWADKQGCLPETPYWSWTNTPLFSECKMRLAALSPAQLWEQTNAGAGHNPFRKCRSARLARAWVLLGDREHQGRRLWREMLTSLSPQERVLTCQDHENFVREHKLVIALLANDKLLPPSGPVFLLEPLTHEEPPHELATDF